MPGSDILSGEKWHGKSFKVFDSFLEKQLSIFCECPKSISRVRRKSTLPMVQEILLAYALVIYNLNTKHCLDGNRKV